MSTPTPLLVVISAPSGAGKTTICHGLLAADPRLARAITCTTRAPRPGERDGVDYYFLTPEAFAAKADAGAFLEHATVHGNRYGTLKSEVLDQFRAGRDVLLNIDVQGAANIRACAAADPTLRAALVTIFVTTASLAVLEARLTSRGQDAPEVIQRRLAMARTEILRWQEFDYLVTSGTMAEDLERVRAIVIAERLRQPRATPPQVE
jgi:guanylate kinase